MSTETVDILVDSRFVAFGGERPAVDWRLRVRPGASMEQARVDRRRQAAHRGTRQAARAQPGLTRRPRPAKITPPQAERIYPRERLFAVLDELLRSHAATWISAQAGAGKTSLAVSYARARHLPVLWYRLDPSDEDLATFFHYLSLAAASVVRRPALPAWSPRAEADPSAFARHYARKLMVRLPAMCVIVFDNYEEVSATASLHDVLRIMLDELPVGLNMLILSRAGAPDALAKLRVDGRVTCLDPNALALTREECAGMWSLRCGGRTPDEAALRALHERVSGWAAGVVLLVEHAGDGAVPRSDAFCVTQSLFEYFASELFERCDATERTVLLTSALLRTISASTARAFTDLAAAPRIIDDLARRNFFTVRRAKAAEPTYEFHPLFREFLLARAATEWSHEHLAALRCRAAVLLEARAEVDDAAELLQAAQAWPALGELVVRQAGLMLAQGRARRLLQWIDSLPATLAERSPWLSYWEGMARMPFDPGAARGAFERAWDGFEGRDPAGLYAAWCGIVEAAIHDRRDVRPLRLWLPRMQHLLRKLPPPDDQVLRERVSCAMFMGLMWSQPGHPQMNYWAERVRTQLRGPEDQATRATVAHQFFFYRLLWLGDVAGAGASLHALEPPASAPLARIPWLVAASHYHLFMGDAQACCDASEEGLQLAGQTDMHAWDLFLATQPILAALYIGNDRRQSDAYVARLRGMIAPGRTHDALVWHSVMGWRSIFIDELDQAEHHLSTAVKLAEDRLGADSRDAFFPQLWRTGLAGVLVRRGRVDEGLALLDSVLHPGPGAWVSPTFEYMGQLTIAEADVDAHTSLEALRGALRSARQRGQRLHLGWHAATMSTLYARAFQHGIECENVRAAVRRLALPAPAGCTLDAWPYPLRVYTLGRFAVQVEDRPLTFATKAQKRPLELLQALIAGDGRAVHEDRLAERLWPDAEPEAATHSLATALYRLRQLVGDAAIRRQDGRLTLAREHCWVDVWALESALSDMPSAPSSESSADMAAWLRTIIMLYRGPFLDGEAGVPGATLLRERLRGKLARRLEAAARLLLAAGRGDDAFGALQLALELDPFAEAILRALMRVFALHGRTAEARAAYEQCLRQLTACDAEPEPETVELADSLLLRQRTR